MRGMMMDRPLLISQLVAYAARYHGEAEIVSRAIEGGIHRYCYPDLEARAKRLAKAMQRLDVGLGDRVATLAWNSFRHLELYFAVSGMGAVCHTVNPRLFHDQLRYIVNHAGDKLLFVDLTFVPAPPATPRARCSRTARPCCTPSRAAALTASPSRCTIRSARWCRCSTPTPGRCRMPRR